MTLGAARCRIETSKVLMTHLRLFTVLLITGGWLQLAEAKEAEKSVQAVVVFDVSGSMRQSDPQRLSVAAAQLFANLSKAGDVVGLATFSDRATTLIPIGAGENSGAREALQRNLTTLRFNGQTTDLAAALEAGLSAFPDREDSSHRRLVLLLTDGAMDLGKDAGEREAAALARIREALIPEYHRRGILLYTIAFTSAADRGFLKEVAEAGAGESHFIADAPALHQAFSQIFVGAHDAQTFPIGQEGVRIDDSIQELSLVFAKSDPRERITLLTPGQRTVQASETAAGMTWQSTDAYDLVHMKQPEAGVWQVDRSDKTQSGVAIIAESTLDLQVELGASFLEVGAPLSLRAFLEDSSQEPARMRHEEGQTIVAEVSAPDGSIVNVPLVLQADGSFSASTPALGASGQYSMSVTAATPTLQRQRTRTFKVYPQCLQGSVVATMPVKARVALGNECPELKDLSIEAEYTAAEGLDQRVALIAAQPNLFEAELPAASGEEGAHVNLRIRGEGPEGAFTLTKGPMALPKVPAAVMPTPALPKEDHGVIARAALKLLQINAGLVILGVLGYGVYWAMRRFRKGHGQ
jgi:Mg-chelatase subunit ChlD